MNLELVDKTALISGSTKGIGFAVASQLAAEGARVIVNGRLERWYAERAKSHMVEVPGASHSVYASRPKEVAALIEEAASHGK
jgi:NAD(P)-dependent dehydrogenase (short-subunit alcohol dehydrogenase family)